MLVWMGAGVEKVDRGRRWMGRRGDFDRARSIGMDAEL